MEKEMFFPSLWLVNGECYEKVTAFEVPKFNEYKGVQLTVDILKYNTDKMKRWTFGNHVAEFTIGYLDFTFCDDITHLIINDTIVYQFTDVHELQMILFSFGMDRYANEFKIFKNI